MQNDLSQLPDYPALQQLARALWRHGSIRGAAVLVGAGFTKNAVRPGVDTPAPPLWGNLVSELKAQLYPSTSNSGPSNPLRVAEEYLTYFGQAALDDFIRSRFPDRAWLPGSLHKQLLNLPWSDVLTTNWDTLLERAADDLDDNQYEVVRSESDLPHAKSPRIVKLHGSIGDNKPLVFTEESYRMYPQVHAAFVNLARQVFIENELCLLGFSGDDPNFLQWTGWVRDQLGGTARRIYLVGYLNLPHATRKFFEARNIAPIDFAPLVENMAEDEAHAASAKYFFEALMAEKPAPPHEWKLIQQHSYPLNKSGAEGFMRVHKDDGFAAEILDITANIFKEDREKYPGWLVCPGDIRSMLRYGTNDMWMAKEAVLSRFNPSRRSEILYEIVWRYRMGFHPLGARLISEVKEMLKTSTSDMTARIREEFFAAVVRDARLSCDDNALDDLEKRVDEEQLFGKQEKLNLHYQRCLRFRDKLDLNSLSAQLPTIQDNDPIWMLRRAALHAELGEQSLAAKLIKAADIELDKRYRLDRASLWIKSRLGWANWLRGAVDTDANSKEVNARRLQDYKQSRIDPRKEIEDIGKQADSLLQNIYEEQSEVVPLFDPGHYRDKSRNSGINGISEASSVHYDLDQLSEIVGLPIRVNGFGIHSDVSTSISKLITIRDDNWYVYLLRATHSHLDKTFNKYFSRVAIAQLTDEASANLILTVSEAVKYWLDKYKAAQDGDKSEDFGFALDRLRLHLHALSRLTVRMSEDNARTEFERALIIAKDAEVRHWWLIEALVEVAKYAAAAVSKERRGSLALSLIEFPLSREKQAEHFKWPRLVEAFWESTPERTPNDVRWKMRIQQIIEASRQDSGVREEAILILTYLFESNALTNDEVTEFASALWSITDGSEKGLPAKTGLFISVISQLPSPPGVDAKDLVYKRLFDIDFTKFLDPAVGASSNALQEKHAHMMAIRQAKRYDFLLKPDLATKIFDQLVAWSPAQVNPKDPFGASIISNFTNNIRIDIGDVMSHVIVPAMRPEDRNQRRVSELIRAISANNLWHGLPGLVDFVSTCPESESNVVALVESSFVGMDHRHVGNAAMAMVRWGELVEAKTLQGLPPPLLNKLIFNIESRYEHGLSTLLACTSALLKRKLLGQSFIDRLLTAMSTLRIETRYAEIPLDSRKAVSTSLIRSECVKLAITLSGMGYNNEIIEGWIVEAKSDPLPEVRFSLIAE